MWCPNCKEEYQEGITVCTECGATLTREKPDTDAPSMEQTEAYDHYEEEEENVEEFLETKSFLDAPDTRQEYVKKADKYRDMKLSGYTFLIFGFLGIVYLLLTKFEVLPIRYNDVIFYIMLGVMVLFIVYGIVSLTRAKKIKLQIPEEEEFTASIKDFLKEQVTKEKIAGWKDTESTEEENDLLILQNIKEILEKQYAEADESYLDMIAEEFFEEHILKNS